MKHVTQADRDEADRLIEVMRRGGQEPSGTNDSLLKGGLDARYYAKKEDFPDKTTQANRHPSSQKFHDLCDAMKAMHDKKQQDYGRENDPFANVRSTEEWGQPAWVGAMIRATDKLRRLQKAAAGGKMANESVEDSFIDLAVYTIIGLVLYQEETKR